MPEIITAVTKLEEGVPYIPGADEYIITEKHTLSDIVRFLVEQAGGDKEDITYILDTYGE